LNADIYHKEPGKYYVGYKNQNGRYAVYKHEGLLKLTQEKNSAYDEPLYKVDLYEVISGKYYPKLEDKHSMYLMREDGKVELIHFSEEGSIGRVVKCHRQRLSGIREPLGKN
jgi:hypothetical protein